MDNKLTPFQQKLAEPIKLPLLAKNLHALMQALDNNMSTYLELAEVIKHYPEITARLIYLANSPWSTPIAPISSIEQACSRLGTKIVKIISIAISIAASFDTRKCPSFSTEHFWTSSMLTAEGASLLASYLPEQLGSQDLEHTAQTAGILHNLGLLWLADNLPSETNDAFRAMQDMAPNLTISEALQQHTGTDHCEVGAWIAQQLKMPEVLQMTMKHHLNPSYHEAFWETALLVGSAAYMASAVQKHTEEISILTNLEKLGVQPSDQELAYQRLGNNYEKTHELAKTLFVR